MKRKKSICSRINHFTDKHFNKFITIFFILIGLTLVLAFIIVSFDIYNGYGLEKAVKKYIKADKNIELSRRVERIDDNKGIAFVRYGCEKKLFKIQLECQGEAYFFIDLIDEKWVINKTSSKIIWKNDYDN